MRTTSPTAPGRPRRRRAARAALAALASGALAGAALVVPATTASAEPVLLSQGKPATASSVQDDWAGYSADKAVDGDLGTRWSSAWSDPQWLRVDLQQDASVDRVELVWEGAYSSAYQVQVSDDASAWRTLYSTTQGDGGTDVLDVDGEGRYVRVLSTARPGGYGHSLYEFRVFGEAGGSGPTDPTDPTDPGDPTDPFPDYVHPGHPTVPVKDSGPSVVKVVGGNGDWDLLVDGQPYTVRGFTWGGTSAEETGPRMQGLADINGNTTRTWGTGADSRAIFDAAAAHDVRVIAGFWLLPGGGPGSGGCIDYRTDTAYKNDTKADILRWVQEYKNHPAVLMWNIGNEAILGLQNCYSGTDLEEIRKAYASFVNEVSVAIHAIDPNHPTSNTDAWTGAWPYIRDNAPDLDLLSINAYGDVCSIAEAWEAGNYGKPYVLTEGGAAGEWEVPDDANGVPDEPTDIEKSRALPLSWKCLMEHEGKALGATFFHYGVEGDFGGVWFNVTPGNNKRLGYHAIAKTWGVDLTGVNTAPRITGMTIPGSTSVTAGATFDFDLAATDPDGDPINYVAFFNSKYVDGAGGLAWTELTSKAAGKFSVTAPSRLGVWKLYVWAEDGKGNVGVETRSFRVVAPPVAGTNIAQGKTTTASSFDPWNGNWSPGQATDGDQGTRWASDWDDDEWLTVDLGSVQAFQHVQLVWESAFGKAYSIQTSNDGQSWTTLRTVTDGDGGVDSLDVAGSGRYVRLDLDARGTQWGYSLFELGVYQR